MLDIVLVLAVLASLLVVAAVSQPLAVRLKLAPVVLLAVIGVAIGAVSLVLLHTPFSSRFGEVARTFADLPVSSETFIYVFLPLLVFEAAITSDVRRMLEDAAPILMLAVVATVVATAAVGVALWPISGQPLVVCLLLGSVVSTTDPAAVIAVFRDVGAPARLTRLVAGEALLNDAAAIVMFVVLLGMIVSGRKPHLGDGAVAFAISFLGGAALGVLAGRALLQLIPWTRDDRLAEATLTVALAYLVFISAEQLFHVSGVVAVLSSRFDRQRLRAVAHHALQLVVHYRSLGSDRLLGAFAGLRARLDSRAEAVARYAIPRRRAGRGADRRRPSQRVSWCCFCSCRC